MRERDIKQLVRYNIVELPSGRFCVNVSYKWGIQIFNKYIPLYWGKWEMVRDYDHSFRWNHDFSHTYRKKSHCVFLINDHYKDLIKRNTCEVKTEIIVPDDIPMLFKQIEEERRKLNDIR